jgi:hypothetical protein
MKKSNNENWFCQQALVRAFEPHDSTRAQTTITQQPSRTFVGVPDVEPFARAAGLDSVAYGETEYPVGSIDKVYSSVALRWCGIGV